MERPLINSLKNVHAEDLKKEESQFRALSKDE
jgi:hypothetical protein